MKRYLENLSMVLAIAAIVGVLLLHRGAGPASAPLPTPDDVALRQLQVFPADNAWNQDISSAPVDAHSQTILERIGLTKPLHPDFGTVYDGAPNGIPFTVIPGAQPRVPVKFQYARESDPGPYPIPPDALIEGGSSGTGDRHVILVDPANKKLYELFSASRNATDPGWKASSGAIFDLTLNAPRRAGWTSADAAGLPIFPGLARFDEVAIQKVVRHAFRFTVVKSRRGYVEPARHFASYSDDPALPPMGMRARLKSAVDLSAFPPQAKVILQTLKTYGMILADNGGDWFLSGAPDPRWDDDDLSSLKRVKISDFEVIEMGRVTTR